MLWIKQSFSLQESNYLINKTQVILLEYIRVCFTQRSHPSIDTEHLMRMWNITLLFAFFFLNNTHIVQSGHDNIVLKPDTKGLLVVKSSVTVESYLAPK